MERPTIEQIEVVMHKLGMKFFTAPWDVTLGGIRTKDNKSNTFNDWLFSCYHDEDGKKHAVILPGTTDAGLYYRKYPMNIHGTAIIQHGVQHKGVYQLQDPSKDHTLRGHMGKKAFRQIKPMKYWRDADRDEYLDFDGEEAFEIAFTNGHYMGTMGKSVDKWSAGCWGSTIDNMNTIYKNAEEQIKHKLGDTFSFALLHENDFE